MEEMKRLLAFLNPTGLAAFETEEDLVGGAAFDAHGLAISEEKRAHEADAVIFGAVGGPKWADVPYDARPEAGLLRLRRELGLFANLHAPVELKNSIEMN